MSATQDTFDLIEARDERKAALIGDIMDRLKDPVAVHLNMLRGVIAKPSFEQIKHLYPAEFAAIERSVKDGGK